MKEILHRFTTALSGRVYLPETLRTRLNDEGGAMLVHVSDTPWEIYGWIRKLLRRVNPRYLVHTGDLVDDIKLEYDPHKRDRWKARSRQLLDILEGNGSRTVYVVPGTHDDPELLEAISGASRVVEAGQREIGGRSFYLDHYGPDGEARAEFDLYGHEGRPKAMQTDRGRLLNGLSSASVIDLSRGTVYAVSYPMDTDRYRLLERGGSGM